MCTTTFAPSRPALRTAQPAAADVEPETATKPTWKELHAPGTCDLCGGPIEQKRVGRPRQHHDECGKVMRLFSQLEDAMEVLPAMDPEKLKATRAHIFYLSNLLNGKKAKGDVQPGTFDADLDQ